MRTLLVYGTIEGHTRKIAQAVARQLERHGAAVNLIDADATASDVAVADFECCIVAGSVHQQRYPDAVNNFVRANLAELNARPSAFISVSISASYPEGLAEARSYAERFCERSGWSPAMTHHAAGALRYTAYDFFQEQIIRHVVLKGRDIDDVSGDHEFTDWDGLAAFVDEFRKRCQI